ncbi:DinB family protein [Micromonospora sp. NBC_00362]|uniref:DinB family protein n=1 Tax=Micromonospora sp. NBC_00362 TaxID=2975975 RepID=UPI00224FB56F|nr:DinB family protein [Micromonospora sp. NBC_00362]MCX5121737.1 DinB family protein [Micromonospora sp. NBC_00362]
MPVSRCDLLRWQFDLTWSLLEYHLERLEPADSLWGPAKHFWTVRPNADGRWMPDWADVEPDPICVPTIGWISWHIGWWWTVAIDHVHGRTPRQRAEISWPGDGEKAVAWLRDLRAQWLAACDRLSETDLDATAPFPWQHDPAYTVAHMLAWVNTELLKNATEIGQLRLLRHARG